MVYDKTWSERVELYTSSVVEVLLGKSTPSVHYYAPLMCSKVTTTDEPIASSTAYVKYNIKNYKNALDKIASLNVFEYDKVDTDEHQIGIIVEDASTPEELIDYGIPNTINENGDLIVGVPAGIKLYSLLGMMIQAFKELKLMYDDWQTQMELATAEAYEKQIENETATQLALAELYESFVAV